MTRKCRHLPPTGYAGQRYEVRAKDHTGKDIGIGWCDQADGGSLFERVNLHPSMHSPYVVDLERDPQLGEHQE